MSATVPTLRPAAETGPAAKLAPRRHKLLTKAIQDALPALYATNRVPLDDKIVHVKFFNPYGCATWWAVEGGPETDDEGEEVDFTFFGAVDLGMTEEPEWGYFSLRELEETEVRMGRHMLPLERDCWWTPKSWAEVRESLRGSEEREDA